jgi:hypothetical protein
MGHKPQTSGRPGGLGTGAGIPAVTILLFLLFAGGGCQTTSDPSDAMPDREESALFTTELGAFMILQHPGGERPEIRYRLRLSVDREIPQRLMMQVTFENPENPDFPIRQRQEIEPGSRTVEIESRPIWGLRRDEIYEVAVETFDVTGNRIGLHRQGILSTIDTRYPDLGRGRDRGR